MDNNQLTKKHLQESNNKSISNKTHKKVFILEPAPKKRNITKIQPRHIYLYTNPFKIMPQIGSIDKLNFFGDDCDDYNEYFIIKEFVDAINK